MLFAVLGTMLGVREVAVTERFLEETPSTLLIEKVIGWLAVAAGVL